MSDPVADLKRELVAAAERQHRHPAVHAGRRQSRPLLGRNRLLLAAATVAIVAAAALVAVAPWSTSTSFLEQAEAALTPPAGTILHQKWVVTTTSTEFGCTVRHRPNESWIDQTPPHRYRVLLNAPPPPEALDAPRRALACWNRRGPELGGFLDSGETVKFVPPNRLTAGPLFSVPVDPVAQLRQELSAGHAHEEGKTQFYGRIVKRIRIDPEARVAPLGHPREPFYWYVDPKTFYPVGMKGSGGLSPGARPFLPLDVVVRFVAYEYLPRTHANLALTDIRAQHPNAKGP